jgi:XTP/dITP diphosphohydrolase
LGGTGIELLEFPGYRDVVEGETDYAENAALKARTLREQLLSAGIEAAVLADDSGLEITALDGRPGVVTAYYGGEHLTWAERREYVLSELSRAEADRRTARFVCYLHYIDDVGAETAVNAYVEGTIAMSDRGEHGFSFDPIFVYPAAQKTFSELTATEKNLVSHRRRAVSALFRELRQQPSRRR